MILFRMDAHHLAEWWEKYNSAQKAYVRGFCGRIEAGDALRNLRYRGDALRIELLVWEKMRGEFKKSGVRR